METRTLPCEKCKGQTEHRLVIDKLCTDLWQCVVCGSGWLMDYNNVEIIDGKETIIFEWKTWDEMEELKAMQKVFVGTLLYYGSKREA